MELVEDDVNGSPGMSVRIAGTALKRRHTPMSTPVPAGSHRKRSLMSAGAAASRRSTAARFYWKWSQPS
ncbi:hypothetical protein OHT59_25125 [Streptomyces sp. NBC_00243]|uniref:hypothetical protein n=1 Tax=Streptomyces sp. NBC_00243 TaxID=2975688 RepID=UPI002DD949D2|nr:hypothetical protein [Streptomyces sp. NBC_00243]WRZ21531.1 hypothetical protein OHT59_25125 [Streptomyces sp. NBC_00243]